MKKKETTEVKSTKAVFETQVGNFARIAASSIFTKDFLDDTSFLNAVDALGVNITVVKNIALQDMREDSGIHNDFIVLKFKHNSTNEELFVKITGTESSYGGLTYEDWCFVKPVTKTVQVFE